MQAGFRLVTAIIALTILHYPPASNDNYSPLRHSYRRIRPAGATGMVFMDEAFCRVKLREISSGETQALLEE